MTRTLTRCFSGVILRVFIWYCNVNFVLTDLVQGRPDIPYRLRFLWAFVLPGFGLGGTVILLRTHSLKDGVFMDLMCRVCCNFGTDMACLIRIVLIVGFVVGLASAWKALFTCGVLLHPERHVFSGEETLYESRLNYIQSVTMSEDLARKRTACKGWMTRASQNLEKVLSDTATLTITKLVSAMEEFDKRWASLDEVQGEYELTIEDDTVLLNDINTAADFRDSVMKSRVLATEKFDELAAPVPDANADNRTNVSNSSVDVKLPNVIYPSFQVMSCNGPVFGISFQLLFMTQTCPLCLNSHIWCPCWRVSPSKRYMVFPSLLTIIQLHVRFWKTGLVGKRQSFSVTFKNFCIFPYHPSALFQLYGNLMMNYRHTLDHLMPSA